MDEAIENNFRDWVKIGYWWGSESSYNFYRALKKVFDEVGMLYVDANDFALGIRELFDELRPDADRELVVAIIDECCERIRVLNAFFEANDVFGFDVP